MATANAIMNAGARLVFDCDDDMCLCYKDVLNKITDNTVAICHVHIGGIVSEGGYDF